MLWPISARRSRSGFSSNALNLRLAIEPEDAHLGRFNLADRLRGDRDVGAVFHVRLDEIAEVHAIEVIARQYQVVVGVVRGKVARRLSHGVGGSLKPVRAVRCLLGGQHLDEAVREHVQAVGLRDMTIE